MNPERPASDHEMLCEIWEMSRKMMAALDEVCYRTAMRNQEKQEAHDQKVRREVLAPIDLALQAGKTRYSRDHGLPEPTPAFPVEVVFSMREWEKVLRALAAPAASKPEAKVKL